MKRLVLRGPRVVRWFGSSVDCIVNTPGVVKILYVYIYVTAIHHLG
jgi:hypothetical protein